jgi:acyl-CoA hydrolase
MSRRRHRRWHLRWLQHRQRAKRMAAIAAPQFRDQLEQERTRL